MSISKHPPYFTTAPCRCKNGDLLAQKKPIELEICEQNSNGRWDIKGGIKVDLPQTSVCRYNRAKVYKPTRRSLFYWQTAVRAMTPCLYTHSYNYLRTSSTASNAYFLCKTTKRLSGEVCLQITTHSGWFQSATSSIVVSWHRRLIRPTGW